MECIIYNIIIITSIFNDVAVVPYILNPFIILVNYKHGYYIGTF